MSTMLQHLFGKGESVVFLAHIQCAILWQQNTRMQAGASWRYLIGACNNHTAVDALCNNYYTILCLCLLTTTMASTSGSSDIHELEGTPIHEKREEVEVLWEIPSNPRAVMLIAHSGRGSPTNFWKPHAFCILCNGLPEHTSIVRNVISQRYAVIAIKSLKDYWQSWPPEASQDAVNVQVIMESWLKEHKLEHLPLAGLGCASGGTFLSMLALRMTFTALVIMISHGATRAFERATNRYPPTLFVHMPKDSLTSAKIMQEMNTLQRKGIPAAEIQCLGIPIYPHFFADNIDQLDAQASSKLYAALVIQGIVNAEGFVLSSLHTSEIHELLNYADIISEEHGDKERESIVESVNCLIRVAEARHAVTGRNCNEILEWLEQHICRLDRSSKALEH